VAPRDRTSSLPEMDDEDPLPPGADNEKELLLQWLDYLRGAILRKLDGVDEWGAHWRPEGRLLSLAGIASHLTNVEWRWIDGGFLGADVSRSEAEFEPDGVTLDSVVEAYRQRAVETEAFIRATELTELSSSGGWAQGHDLRWVVLHLINETARHAGHADATRELLDGTVGE
jgi:uncharacterized damage-inducible protein DinB